MSKPIKKKKRIIDPFATEAKIDKITIPEERELSEGISDISYLEQLKLNLVMTLGSPWRAKYDLIERQIAILNMIEKNKDMIFDSKFLYVYERMVGNIHNQLEKLDKVWKDLNTKRSSQEQLRAFQNMEMFLEFLQVLGSKDGNGHADEYVREFIEFLKTKNLFIE